MHLSMGPTVLLLMLLELDCLTAAAQYSSLPHKVPHKGWPQQNSADTLKLSLRRQPLQYTGAVVAGSKPTPTAIYCCCPSASHPTSGSTSYRSTAYAPNNPAVAEVSSAMRTGGAPSDIATLKARGYIRGKILGHTIDAAGQASANCGCNSCGGITACGSAEGSCCICGPAGSFQAAGQARAAAATARGSSPAGGAMLSGAAAAEAAGCFLLCAPDGSTIQGQGRAGAFAEGSLVRTPPKSGAGSRPQG